MAAEVIMMKKMLMLLFVTILLLAGCDIPDKTPAETTEPTETTMEMVAETTEPTEPWIDVVGMPWDSEGALLEIPLTVPDGMHYSSCVALDGDLLLWSFDYHLPDTKIVELCVLELDDGTVTAQRDISLPGVPTVQVLGDSIYLIHAESGHIEMLNKHLKTVQVWNTEPVQGNCLIGGDKLYINEWESTLLVRDLVTGETQSLMEGDPAVSHFTGNGNAAMISYYRPDTGAPVVAALDLISGEIIDAPVQGDYTLFTYGDGVWLCGAYRAGFNVYTLAAEGAEPVSIQPGGGTLQLIDGNYLLYSSEMDTYLRLHDLQGNCLSECDLSAEPYSYYVIDCIWSETFGGYFCPINCYDGNQRLLFWDITGGRQGDALVPEPLPAASETDALLKERALEIGNRYGLTILVSNDCDTIFDEFTAQIADDYNQVSAALDTLEEALAVYPEGFFRQLRYGSVYGIRIQLITDLIADGSGRYGDSYIAFAQENWDHYLVVIDIADSDQTTYYHEFSHIIDSYLEWDSWQREDALYSEAAWAAMNPGWFTGYSYDYSVEHELEDWTSFVDGYSTISPTEDRARVMEYAMSDFGLWTFEDADILQEKLDFYCRCIRDAFDTEGWPETLPWEQYLYLK